MNRPPRALYLRAFFVFWFLCVGKLKITRSDMHQATSRVGGAWPNPTWSEQDGGPSTYIRWLWMFKGTWNLAELSAQLVGEEDDLEKAMNVTDKVLLW